VAGRIDILLISKVTGTAGCLFNVRLCSVATRHHVRSRGSYGGGQADRACGLQLARLGQLAGELRDLGFLPGSAGTAMAAG
jgi:hypothetical protein